MLPPKGRRPYPPDGGRSSTKQHWVTQISRKYPALIDAKMGIDWPEQRRLDAGSASTFYEIADDLICLDGHASQEISIHG